MTPHDTAAQSTLHRSLKRFWQPPFVGIITALLMLFGVGLAHALMVAFAEVLG